MAQDGAAIATVIAEFLVTASMIFLGKKYLPLRWNKTYWVYMVASLLMGVAVYLCGFLNYSKLIVLFISFVAGILVYVLCLVVAKDPFYLQLE